MALLTENEKVGSYRVVGLIKANHYTETYKVSDEAGQLFFLKLFILSKLPSKLLNVETKCVKEIEYCRSVAHKNLVAFATDGTLEKEVSPCQYYVTEYFTGTILSDYVQTRGVFSEEDALAMFRKIMVAIKYLHEQSPALCHNDLDPSNIMLSATMDGEPVLIDYGHVSPACSGFAYFDTSDLNLLYHAKETMVGIFDERGDLYSACAVLYFMLTGKAPWEAPIPVEGDYKERFKALWMFQKAHPLNLDSLQVSAKTKYLISHGLELKASDRFASADEIIATIDNDNSSEPVQGNREETTKPRQSDGVSNDAGNNPDDIGVEIKRGGGNGFADIAGMQELKDYLQQKVIFVITNKELASQYRLTPPNGMLLYGPPGCGKTFFAEKFAEETKFNFMLVKSSDIGSSLVHGTEEKIKKLFKKAEKNSPIVLCFDEFDAIVPDRGAHGNEYVASEVNEFLAQMNNCAKRGIFIVATSNRPDKIDPAILRTGRIDKQVYVPLPDFEARKEMFKLYLANRPFDGNADLEKFATETDGYIASDIAYIVNDAAMTAAFSRTPITEEILENTIRSTKPSLRKETLEEYKRIQDKMDGIGRRVVVETL